MRSMLTAGLDTTIIGIGNALFALAAQPRRMAEASGQPGARAPRLRRDAALRIAGADLLPHDDARRPNSAASRCPQDAKILLFLAGANRDPRRWDDPDRFDVTRKAHDHAAFGAGIHKCVGQMLARLETEMILTALLKRFADIALAGEPTRKLNNTLRQLARLPMQLTAA